MDIKEKTTKLNEKAMEFATKVYEEAAKQAQANEANQSGEEPKKDDKDDAIDAEYEEK